MSDAVIKVVIPAQNEERAIGKVISEIPDFVSEVIIADNGSTDNTAKVAREVGATVISVPEAGYGRACLGGIAAAGEFDILVFLDGDASDYPEDMGLLIGPIRDGEADMVIGSRVLGELEKGSLTPQQRFGNALACWLMKLIWKHQYTDLGPFRAISREGLEKLNMEAPTFGWTVEMQIRALKHGLRCQDAPVRYRKRIGKSKISGTLKGVVMAGVYILGTIFVEAVRR
jgi:glycosyltransferase involved in cell wall biosynthesis